MTEYPHPQEVQQAAASPPVSARASLLTGFLDWTLAAALLAALATALPYIIVKAFHTNEPLAAWSQFTVLFSILAAFAGATVGATGWTASVVTRKIGLIPGVLVGTLTGVALATIFFGLLIEPLAGLLALQRENQTRLVRDRLTEWFLPEVLRPLAGLTALVALGFAIVAWRANLRKRRQ